jgi:hypothetical protein
MANPTDKPPEFFDERPLDPVTAATGSQRRPPSAATSKTRLEPKRKAGFYLSNRLLDRFNRKFHELKLHGIDIDNKSALLETALTFALDDMDQGDDSRILQQFT